MFSIVILVHLYGCLAMYNRHNCVWMEIIMSNILRTKCVIVGNCTVGKTALSQTFLSDGRQFSKNYNMTFGVDLKVKTLSIPDSNDTVELFIYDSSGQDVHNNCLSKYWHEPNILMAVFDVTSELSLDSVSHWVALVRSTIPQKAASTTPGVLFGNKTDLVDRRVVSPKTGSTMAEKLGLMYFEGSAKENQGIEEPFFLLAHEWHKLYSEKKTAFDLIA
ncbi:intraflagellar transport protein 27 homolog [Zootermopsis nevadensis]|uniref:Putative GTP-binding protein RAY-like n=1 Tax=Zootermopsis nevadensis TaxID=136037 RepID=A0A067R087_ZOONE|nr:intraflagellar transport protein 27 homolog [Zootermopsis nevadensis]KDR10846.1 Putative GTP-binding protein RAY-like [Zootermopsis nevadensis]